jgi:hypothetical protein
VRFRQLELVKGPEGKKAVYLHIKFWIILRDMVTGLRSDQLETNLLSSLREGVAEGRLFCPVRSNGRQPKMNAFSILASRSHCNMQQFRPLPL